MSKSFLYMFFFYNENVYFIWFYQPIGSFDPAKIVFENLVQLNLQLTSPDL